MAGNHSNPKRSGSAAVRTRHAPPRSLLLAIAAVLILTALIVVAVRSARSHREAAAAPAETPAPVQTAAPTAEASAETAAPAVTEAPAVTLGAEEPAPEATAAPVAVTMVSDLPEAMYRVPADTSGEIAARNVTRRDGFPMLSWNIDKFRTDARGRMLYYGDTKTLTGVDVSEHQYGIDWARVAADGIDFAMIRLGYRGSTAGGLYVDEYFERNISGALQAGLPVGVYFYSQAVTPAEAKEEAAFVLEHLRGYNVTFPVVYDWEIVGGSDVRTYTVSRQTLVACTRAFCDAVAAEGYDPMIYFTQYLGYRKYILRNLADYAFWYAQYDPQPRIAYDFDMWQYTETGYVSGIEGEVDLNLYFVR